MPLPVGYTTTHTLTAQAAGTVNGIDQQNAGYRGAVVTVDITAIAAGSLTVTVQGKDPASGKYYTILAGAALSATGTTVLRIFDGATASANVAVNDVLPAVWRIIAVVATGPVTATIGVSLIP
jgi:hypothetical protein